MKKIALAVAALSLVAVFAALPQTPAKPKYHVVFQVTEPLGDPAWDFVTPHITNLRKALGPENVQVEVVFFGPGLGMLLKKNSAYADRLKELADEGVRLAACQNAMRLMKVTTDDLYPFAAQVDSGVAELTRKQQEGWQYIH